MDLPRQHTPDKAVSHDEPELVGKLASSSTYDQAFLSCTDGYCIFNAEQRLSAYSSKLANLYPAIRNDIYIGMRYMDYLRLFVEKKAVQNLDGIEDIDAWLAAQVNTDITQASYKHLLYDGRWMEIKFNKVTGDQWLFTAQDITSRQQQQQELRKSEHKMICFARLSSDWFWELDENLCYKYFSSHVAKNVDTDQHYLGKSRVDVLEESAVRNDQLHLHISQMRRRESVDVTIEWKSDSEAGFFAHVVAEPQFDEQGTFTGYIGCGRNVSNEIRLQRQLQILAEFDDLTGLRNRRSFENHLNETIASLHYDWQPKTLAFIDLDRFKQVNDSSGHQAGDMLLVKVARELERVMTEQAVVARLGGDEFGVILNLDVDEAFKRVAEFVRSVSTMGFEWKERKHTIGASAGLTTINDYQADPSELMIQADTACYSAKNSGRNQARVYSHRATRANQENKEPALINLLRDALEKKKLQLFLQPIKAIREGTEQEWFEVLVRLTDGTGKSLTAAEVMPVAEKYQLTSQLDRQVLRCAIDYIERFRELGVDVLLSVNLSGYSLSNPDFREWIQSTLNSADIRPENLGFDLSENSAIQNLEPVIEFAQTLKDQGYRFALDDFGSQLSSFEYIRRLPLNFLKIDGNVIKDMAHNATCRVIVSTFIKLSHELGIETIAEYVENRETENLLLRAGVDYVQGYSVGTPLSAEKWLEWYQPDQQRSEGDLFGQRGLGKR